MENDETKDPDGRLHAAVEAGLALVALAVGYVAASEFVKRHFGHHLT